MQIVKNLFSRVTAVWSLYGYVTRINTALKTWPGTENEIRLRAWLLDHLALLSGLAAKTVNPVDDAVVYYTLRIVENDTAWKILFNMLSFAGGVCGVSSGETVPQLDAGTASGSMAATADNHRDCIRSLYEIGESLGTDTAVIQTAKVENPMLVISAVGLILQVVQYLRSR